MFRCCRQTKITNKTRIHLSKNNILIDIFKYIDLQSKTGLKPLGLKNW